MSAREGVAAYWAQLQRTSSDVVNTTHVTLGRLYGQFGRDSVDAEIDTHVARERAEQALRDAETVRAFYASYGITAEVRS
jgi:hypothetical protein